MPLLFVVGATSHGAKVIIEPVGIVKQHYVTSREVQIHYLISEVLFSDPFKPGNLTVLPVDSQQFRSQLNAVLLEWMVYFEAKSFGMDGDTNKESSKYMAKVQGRLARSKPWQSLEVGATETREFVERAILAKKFIEFKEDTSRVPITDEEARKYYQENSSKYPDHPFEFFAKAIKAHLRREQANSRLVAWFQVLEGKYKAKSLVGAFDINEEKGR